ncbi:hypothetical protein BDQ17DRAFT_221387 [Cyathus striatus]|nr:hypothetical protein BDQ17DRAFT_221387 [Cyathus striatus]
MHFSKTYAQLLLSLPPELRDNAIQYRQLKKLINQIVRELSSLGLDPTLLHEIFDAPPKDEGKEKEKEKEVDPEPAEDHGGTEAPEPHKPHSNFPKVVYEFNADSNRIEPRLRFWVNFPEPSSSSGGLSNDPLGSPDELEEELEETSGFDSPHTFSTSPLDVAQLKKSLLWSLQHREEGGFIEEVDTDPVIEVSSSDDSPPPPLRHIRGTPHEIVIPLVSDTQFFELLSTALEAVSARMTTVQSNFYDSLKTLSRTIADTARPASYTSTAVKPHSGLTSHGGSIRVPNTGMSKVTHHHTVSNFFPSSLTCITHRKSDLYSWREIFQLYVETEVFESVSEATRGERTVEDSEERLKKFADRVAQRGLGDKRKLKLAQSRRALEGFLELNLFILNVKKFAYANSEATRKILKKHTKRTALPLPLSPSSLSSPPPQLTILTKFTSTSLPRVLVQAVGETLLPVIPHVDDYACLICTGIAFKPIRLNCGHLFCVQCLVKMQKRGKGNCPMCRAPCVLTADRSNVDWALVNFMQDWFPVEAKEKLKLNEKEAAEEELIELGLDPNQSCCIM